MRHQMQKSSSFGRHRSPRKALIRGLVNSLIEKERIKTTLAKAKCVRPLIEKAVTMGKRNDVHSHRLLFSRYPNRKTVDKIMNILSPRFKNRPGGYTRIIKLGLRSGDQAPIAYLEFVDYNAQAKPITQKVSKKETKAGKETTEKVDTKKATSVKTSSTKLSDNKKQKKQMIATVNKKRKKIRQQQKKSRRINR